MSGYAGANGLYMNNNQGHQYHQSYHHPPPQSSAGSRYSANGGGGSYGSESRYGAGSQNGNRSFDNQAGYQAGIYQHPHHPAQVAARQQQQSQRQQQQQQQQPPAHQQQQQPVTSHQQDASQGYHHQQTRQHDAAANMPYQPQSLLQQQQQQQRGATAHQGPVSSQRSNCDRGGNGMNSQSSHHQQRGSNSLSSTSGGSTGAPPTPVPAYTTAQQRQNQQQASSQQAAAPAYANSPSLRALPPATAAEKFRSSPQPPPRPMQSTPPLRPIPQLLRPPSQPSAAAPSRLFPTPPRQDPQQSSTPPPRQHQSPLLRAPILTNTNSQSPSPQPGSGLGSRPSGSTGGGFVAYRPPSVAASGGESSRPPPLLPASNGALLASGGTAASAARLAALGDGLGSALEGIMNDLNSTNKRKREVVSPPLEGLMNANPKILLVESPVFRGCTQQSLPFILDSIGSLSNPQYRAALKIPTKDGGESWAIGIWKTKKEAERLSALDACRQLHAAGLLTANGGTSSSGRSVTEKDNSNKMDLAWGENPKNILVNTPVFRAICGKGNAGGLPLKTYGRGPDHNKLFVCELPVPLGNGQVFLAQGTAKTKADAERLACTIACHKLHEKGLLQKPAKGEGGPESMIKAAIVQQQNEIPPVLQLGERECVIMENALQRWHAEGQPVASDPWGAYDVRDGSGGMRPDYGDPTGHNMYSRGEICGNGLANGFERISMTSWDEDKCAVQNELLKKEAERRMSDPALSAQRNARAGLPAFKERQMIVEMVQKNRAVVLTGETGCGKTTQVPQFILEDAELHGCGTDINIVVTQPRRIAAISVAERVAWERGEQIGNSVGYAIRLDSVNPRPKGNIIFCTTGILLRRLQRSDGLDGVSHVVVDEVHERDMDTDFLLIVMREILRVNCKLKLIVMSATLDATNFQRYFGSCPLVTIPGFTFPVQVKHLEELPSMMGSACPPAVLRAVSAGQHGQTRAQKEEDEDVDTDLAAATILWVGSRFGEGDGAVLCFLPGWDVISTVKEKLLVMPGSSKLHILLLHSQIPVGDQRAVFAKAPPGMRKVILATNIAETSVTIDDIVYVVDCGKVKENQFDPARNMTAFRVVWTSKSSARQRQGRAGRVQPGFCFRLYSKAVHDSMAEHQVPEMQRMPLEELCLQIKALSTPLNPDSRMDSPLYSIGNIESFLSKALQPPATSAVILAIKVLQQIGAIDESENLTVLGRTLAKLAVHPRIGKMLVYGALLGCLDPLLTIAAAACFRDPFLSPIGKRAEVDRIRESFAVGSCTRSDHLVLVQAFDAWESAAAMDGGRGYMFCDINFLSSNTMRLIGGMRKQFDRTLRDSHLTDSWVRIPNKEEAAVVARSVITAGLYPNVAKSEMYREAKGGKNAKSYRYRLGFRAEGSRVFVHPTSVIVEKKLNSDSHHFLVFQEKLLTTLIFARQCTLVPPLSLVFFGGLVRLQNATGVPGLPPGVSWEMLDVDGFLRFGVERRVAGLLLQLRQALDIVLARWVAGAHRTDGERAIVECVVELLKRASGPLFV
ncbi:hypothetical protein CBR_g12733 [Chara braunii]|uniref:RNA helicase n=1 Tax=Chara braunii TaxID=69332 RepID=A0A388KSH8_CHABU|nr:hypothetical protein CBR_g12733 [Chara braunii]|eukprot:GBG73014.1 hypothetical protein CBR_g12733 [Chara braunii]